MTTTTAKKMMKKRATKKPAPVFLNAKEHGAAIRKVMASIKDDGHTIWDPKLFLDAGLPEAWVAKVTEKLKSKMRNPKEIMFDRDGHVIREQTAVHGLEALRVICIELGGKYSDKMGRGWAARDYTEQIYKLLDAAGV